MNSILIYFNLIYINMSCYLSSTGLDGDELIYLDADDTIIESSNELKFNFNDNVLVKINKLGLFVFENNEWWNVKEKLKTLISLIYKDSNEFTNVSSLTEIHFPIDGVSHVKIDSSGLNVYNGTEWWNVKDKIQTILYRCDSLDGRHLVFETQLIALKGEMYAVQLTQAYHSFTLLAQGLSLTGHGNSINNINDSITGIGVDINHMKDQINYITNLSILNTNNLNVSQFSILNEDTTSMTIFNVLNVSV